VSSLPERITCVPAPPVPEHGPKHEHKHHKDKHGKHGGDGG
jgi:hypothetical protein